MMTRDFYLTALTFIMIIISPYFLHAHGVDGFVGNGGLTITAQYDSGEAMSYAKVTIAAPGTELPFQSGRTDRNGRFCLFPDTPGEWEVVVDDAMGHRLALKVPVNEQLVFQDARGGVPDGRGGLSKILKALLGVSLIGNIVLSTKLLRK